MPNFSSLAGLEVAEKFRWWSGVAVVEHVTTMSITTSSREISVVWIELCIFPYHEIGLLTWRRGGE